MTESTLMTVRIFAGLGMAFLYGFIGFIDDYIKVVKKRNLWADRPAEACAAVSGGRRLPRLGLSGRRDQQGPISPSWGRLTSGFSTGRSPRFSSSAWSTPST